MGLFDGPKQIMKIYMTALILSTNLFGDTQDPVWDLTLNWAMFVETQSLKMDQRAEREGTLDALHHPVWIFPYTLFCVSAGERPLHGPDLSWKNPDKYSLHSKKGKEGDVGFTAAPYHLSQSLTQHKQGQMLLRCCILERAQNGTHFCGIPTKAYHLDKPLQPPQTYRHSTKHPSQSLHDCWSYQKQGWSGKFP